MNEGDANWQQRKNYSAVPYKHKAHGVRVGDKSPPLSSAHGYKKSHRKSNSTDSKKQQRQQRTGSHVRTPGFRQNMPNKGQMKMQLQESHYKQIV